VGRFDSRRWWTVLPLIPFTTPHNRGLRRSAFCGELQKAEFERNVIRKRTLAGLKAARARGRVGGGPEKLSVRDKQQIRAAAQRPPKFASRTWRAASGSAWARCTNRWVPWPRRNRFPPWPLDTRTVLRFSKTPWKHANLYGAYSFLDIGDGVDLQELVNLLEAARGRGAAAPD
jgi:hypothetical protein